MKEKIVWLYFYLQVDCPYPLRNTNSVFSNCFALGNTSTCPYSGWVVTCLDLVPLFKARGSQIQTKVVSVRLGQSPKKPIPSCEPVVSSVQVFLASSFENFHSTCSTMSSISASFILFENVRLTRTRTMSKHAKQGSGKPPSSFYFGAI